MVFYELKNEEIDEIVKHDLPSWLEAITMLKDGRVIALSEYDILMELRNWGGDSSNITGFIPPRHYVIEGQPCTFAAFAGTTMCYDSEDGDDFYLDLTENGLVQVNPDATSFNFIFPPDKAEQ